MRTKFLDLHLVLLGGLATLALAPLAALRYASPAPLSITLTVIASVIGAVGLVATGYAFTAACFPRVALGVTKRLTYSLGFSFALIALGGLALNLTPWGLSYTSWAVYLGVVTLLAGAIALLRGDGRALSLDPLLGWALPDAQARLPQRLRAGALVIAALVGVGGAVALSTAGANHAQQTEQTAIGASLWMLPITHAGHTPQVEVGVRNLSADATPFRLTLTVDSRVVRSWSTLTLSANQTWTTTIPVASLTTGAVSGAEQVTATLALASAPTTTYRQVMVWVTAPASAHSSGGTAASVGESRRPAPMTRA